MELAPRLVEHLLYGMGGRRRWTQDSPVLPDVWAAFASPTALASSRSVSTRGNGAGVAPLDACDPQAAEWQDRPLELLLTPHYRASPGTLAREIRARLERLGRPAGRAPTRVAYTQSYTAAQLYFDEVVRVLLPLTSWWRHYVWKHPGYRDEDGDGIEDRVFTDLTRFDADDLTVAIEQWSWRQSPDRLQRTTSSADLWGRATIRIRDGETKTATSEADEPRRFPVADDLLWMVRIIGAIQWGRRQSADAFPRDRQEDCRITSLPRHPDGSIDYAPIVAAGTDVLTCDLSVLESDQASLWQINRNRPAEPASAASRRAIKADAATDLFSIRCDELHWAVIDSGIDARHPAFSDTVESDEVASSSAPPADWAERTRVVKTYDFTRLRPLLQQESLREIIHAEPAVALLSGEEADASVLDLELDGALLPLLERIDRHDEAGRAAADAAGDDYDIEDNPIRRKLQELRRRLQDGWDVDWDLLEPVLEVPHDERYAVPTSDHGTHVAGILAGRACASEKFCGVCPDLKLYDLRVFDPHGPNDELTVLAALQFIDHLNRHRDRLTVQGVNLSLSIPHEVSSYACGRTPVCEECERLVSGGVVVVAAAGNAGWDDSLARAGAGAGYRTVSITDPGNAEAVITVGATHRERPHTYGVSFFSGRGPTGDGRLKPDLVAPGEKIRSCVPGNDYRRDDGTSMAAPHVSGAVALILARHEELIGQPQRVKSLLCDSATDLGRERHFQGAGMLDVLRALQAI